MYDYEGGEVDAEQPGQARHHLQGADHRLDEARAQSAQHQS